MDNTSLKKNINDAIKKINSKENYCKIKIQKKRFQDLSIIPADAEYEGRSYICYVNLKTGEVLYKAPKSKVLDTKYNGLCQYSTIEYDKAYNAIKIIKVSYKLGDKIWSDLKDEKIVNKKNKINIRMRDITISYILKDKSYYGMEMIYDSIKDKYFDYNIPNINTSALFGIMNIDKEKISKIFSDFFGIGFLNGNKYTNFSNIEDIPKFLKAKNITKKSSTKQNKINELSKYKLKDLEIKFTNNVNHICIANRVNEEYAVLRYFIALYDKTPYEISRFYVSKEDYLFARRDTNDNFVYLANKLTAEHFKSDKMYLESTKVFDGTMLEYFKEICNELNDNEKGTAMYILTTQPLFERLYKAGLKSICLNYIKENNNMLWETYLNTMFSYIDFTQKNINKMLGFNNHQLAKINTKSSYIQYRHGIGAEMKNIFDKDSLADMDDKTFDTFFDYIVKVAETKSDSFWNEWWCVKTAMKATIKTYSIKVCINMFPLFDKYKSSIVQTTRSSWGNEYISRQNALYVYADYIDTVRLLNSTSDMRPYFNDLDDLSHMHDDAMTAYNIQEDEIKNEAFIKRSDFWKKWEYSENENFIVMAPTIPADLATEGITLHHCVKTYIERVANERTNIMFIRKKEDPVTPFFTVEVSNTGSIEQVHGFANRNASTEPGLTEFVKEWAKAKKLNITNFNKVR